MEFSELANFVTGKRRNKCKLYLLGQFPTRVNIYRAYKQHVTFMTTQKTKTFESRLTCSVYSV